MQSNQAWLGISRYLLSVLGKDEGEVLWDLHVVGTLNILREIHVEGTLRVATLGEILHRRFACSEKKTSKLELIL